MNDKNRGRLIIEEKEARDFAASPDIVAIKEGRLRTWHLRVGIKRGVRRRRRGTTARFARQAAHTIPGAQPGTGGIVGRDRAFIVGILDEQ